MAISSGWSRCCAGVFIAALMAAGCDSADEDYCLRNQGDLRPLFIGEQWLPELGILDDAHSNCHPLSTQPALSWRSKDASVTVTQDGSVTAQAVGAFSLSLEDDEGTRLLSAEGFVLPRQWQLQVGLPDVVQLAPGAKLYVPLSVVDANGAELPGVWIFSSSNDISVADTLGCKPWRETQTCRIAAAAVGTARIRFSLAGQRREITVQVGEAPAH